MKREVIVISLGGSLIVPNIINTKFLKKFIKVLKKNEKNYKFVIVCGGGFTARKYMDIAKRKNKNKKQIGLEGMRATKENAEIVIELLNTNSNKILPKSKSEIKRSLKKLNYIITGSLKYSEKETSDGTAAKLAHYLNSNFINMTNTKGLFTSDPKKNKLAKFIPNISWKEFLIIASKRKFKLGQHFILDQNTAKIIKKNKIKTYIIGPKIRNFHKLLNNKKFKGTIIENDK